MKLVIPGMLTKFARHPRLRSALAIGGLCLMCASLVFAAGGKINPKRASAPRTSAAPVRVLMVGDSLTVGSFGGVVGDYLATRFGANNVAVFGSCGSSPENWLRAEPRFASRCGYREDTPGRKILREKTRAPQPAPKIENLLATYQPNLVLVQLGTNWFDLLAKGGRLKRPNYDEILDRFTAAIHRASSVRQIIWITPPDSSRFRGTQSIVENLIRRASARDDFSTIISSKMTRYSPGRTGGDGVHYNTQSGADWARKVIAQLPKNP